MSNPLNARPFTALDADMRRLGFSEASIRAMRDMLLRSDKVLTDKGEVQSVANISGRTEQLSATLQNVDASGNLQSLTNVNDTSTDHLTDGTGSPLTGGKRGAIALDANNRLAGTFRNNPVNVNGFFTAANPLSQVGVTTVIAVAGSIRQFGDGQVTYNSGSVDPGLMGTYQVYADDATFAGGAMTYAATTSNSTLTASNARRYFGQITTTGGGGGTGSGGGDNEPDPGLH